MKLPEPSDSGYFNDATGKMEPLYTAAQMIEYRNAALEEAAKVCEQFTHYGEASGIICVKAIRELKEMQS